MTDKAPSDNRQKIILGIVIVVFAILGYIIYGMFAGGGSSAPESTPMTAQAPATPAPQPAQLLQNTGASAAAPLSEREMALMKLQQETQAKYLAALNELQMLKVEKDIAETTKAIAAAKLETITAQKNMVDLLQPQQTIAPNYAQGLAGGASPQTVAGQAPTAPTTAPATDSYTVISVSHLQGRWNAILGYKGKLLNVSVGDVLPSDGSTVTAISKSGVTLKNKDGDTQKISLISVI